MTTFQPDKDVNVLLVSQLFAKLWLVEVTQPSNTSFEKFGFHKCQIVPNQKKNVPKALV